MGRLKEDIAAFRDRDPAARSNAEVFLCYSGLHAIHYYRVANFFYRHNWKFLARAVSQWGRHHTGVEIHPAAKIGRRLVIDHGMGIVIGETAVIGDDCLIYHGVTLGGTGKEKGKRHPTLGNHVVIGAGAKVLGGITIGDNSKIASGAVVLSDVPPNCTAVGVPARIVKRDGLRTPDLDQVHIPDPVAQEINRLQAEVNSLKQEIEKMKQGE